MTKQTFQKYVVLEFANVRITKNDELNYLLETLEQSEVDGEQKERYVFRGYSGSIVGALKILVTRGLLVDKSLITGLQEVVKRVETSNRVILEALEDYKKKGGEI